MQTAATRCRPTVARRPSRRALEAVKISWCQPAGGCAVANEVVAHFLDGRVVKGISLDIDPARPTCHIRIPNQQAVEVKLADLKALFFVKSLAGDPTHKERSTLDAGDQRARGAHPIEVEFADGERVVG